MFLLRADEKCSQSIGRLEPQRLFAYFPQLLDKPFLNARRLLPNDFAGLQLLRRMTGL